MNSRSIFTFFDSSSPKEVEDEFFDVELGQLEPLLTDEEKFSDAKEAPALTDIIVEAPPVDQPDHTPKKFLIDEVAACIEILEHSKKNEKVNIDKLNELQYYSNRIIMLKNSIGLIPLLGGWVPWLIKDNARSEAQDIQNQLLDTLVHTQKTLDGDRDLIVNKYAACFSQQSTQTSKECDYAKMLSERQAAQTDWWTWWASFPDSCYRWRARANRDAPFETYYAFKPTSEFNGTNFCWGSWPYLGNGDKANCRNDLNALCGMDEKIYVLKQNNHSSYLKEFDQYLNAQYEVSGNFLDVNRHQELLDDATMSAHLYAALGAGISLAAAGCMIYFTVKFNQAYRAYQEDLLHAGDAGRCLHDPNAAYRINNLTSRFNLSLDKKIDVLINELQQEATKIHERRRVRLAFMSIFQHKFERVEDMVDGVEDTNKLILNFADLSPEQQSPKPQI